MPVHHPHTARGEAPALGILTTLGPSRHCRAQAKVLGWLLQRYYPDVPRAVVGHPDHIGGLAGYGWELVATEDPDLQRGFESKLSLWRYTPFERTLFLDVDVVPLPPRASLHRLLHDLLTVEAPVRYYAWRLTADHNFQGTRIADLEAYGMDGLWATIGGGHYCWDRGPEAQAVFERADEIARAQWDGIVRYASPVAGRSVTPDEVVVAIALEQLYPEVHLPRSNAIRWSEYWRKRPQGVQFVHFQNDKDPRHFHRLLGAIGAPRRLQWETAAAWGWQATQQAWTRLRKRG